MRISEFIYKIGVTTHRQTAVHTKNCWKSYHIVAGNIEEKEANFFDSTTEIKRRVCQ